MTNQYNKNLVERSIHTLLASIHLYLAGARELTNGEWYLIEEIADWWYFEGEDLADLRRLEHDKKTHRET